MYSVIRDFVDLIDSNYLYHAGDVYPRAGYEADEDRIKELSTKANKVGEPVIKDISEAKPKKSSKKKEE